MKHINFTEYQSHEGVSNSQLKHLARCPKVFKHFVLDENETVETDNMRLGGAFHTLVLEPELFEKMYHITPKIRRTGDAWKKVQEVAATKLILWEADYQMLLDMSVSIHEHAYAARLLENTENEASMFWETAVKNKLIKCRGRIDAIKKLDGKIALIDLKSTADASEDAFTRQLFKLKYYMQASYYMDGYETLTGEKPGFFVFIAVETKAPYLCGVYVLSTDSDVILKGREEYTNLLETYCECTAKNDWSEAYDKPVNIVLPSWYN
jgi:exodeoxyribonuclease VIII